MRQSIVNSQLEIRTALAKNGMPNSGSESGASTCHGDDSICLLNMDKFENGHCILLNERRSQTSEERRHQIVTQPNQSYFWSVLFLVSLIFGRLKQRLLFILHVSFPSRRWCLPVVCSILSDLILLAVMSSRFAEQLVVRFVCPSFP